MSILLSKRISIIRGYSILLAGGAVFFFLSVLGLSGQEKQLLDIMSVSFRDDVALDLHVHHDEVCAIE